jgi:hypothetical protein
MSSDTKEVYLNFNDLSDLGLIYKINKEVLHPLGIALSRYSDGTSPGALIDTIDFNFEYSKDSEKRNIEKYDKFVSNRIEILKEIISKKEK